VAGALLLAWGFRACVAEPYRIPTASMARTLLPGDYVLVSKLGYGGPLSWSDPERGDVIAFDYPPDPGRGVYVKRIVGAPGDTVAIRAKEVWIDGVPTAFPPDGRIRWRVRAEPGETLPLDLPPLADLDPAALGESLALVTATSDEIARVRRLPSVAEVWPDAVPRGFVGAPTFPARAGFSRDFWGPLRVPARGDTIRLDARSWMLTADLLRRHEGRTIRRIEGRFEEGGAPVEQIVLERDYFFVLGDSRDDSDDSRAWGFVPRDHVRGRVALIYFSSGEGGVRWRRVGRSVR
jgi:signal peptidase I